MPWCQDCYGRKCFCDLGPKQEPETTPLKESEGEFPAWNEHGCTPGPRIVDIRTGCAAVYQPDRRGDTNGCHAHDSRNIAYWTGKGEESSPGAYRLLTPLQEANATAIAALPELYEALRQTVKYWDEHQESWSTEAFAERINAARTALSKATGGQRE